MSLPVLRYTVGRKSGWYKTNIFKHLNVNECLTFSRMHRSLSNVTFTFTLSPCLWTHRCIRFEGRTWCVKPVNDDEIVCHGYRLSTTKTQVVQAAGTLVVWHNITLLSARDDTKFSRLDMWFLCIPIFIHIESCKLCDNRCPIWPRYCRRLLIMHENMPICHCLGHFKELQHQLWRKGTNIKCKQNK